MANSIGSRFKRAWNAFVDDDSFASNTPVGYATYYRPDRVRTTRGNERSIITAVYNRIAIDVSSITIQHVRLDDNDRFYEVIDSGLNRCLNLNANIDQTGRDFIKDVVMSMMDEGSVAIVPVDTDVDPTFTDSYDIRSMRTGKIVEWYPDSVKVRLYNDRTGRKEEIILAKRMVTIIENPFYAIMNEPNSILQRLIRKLNLLDAIDEQSGAGKLDLIIQLPYVIKSQARQDQAEKRRKEIERQLAGSKYGIAYTDGTEHITQLNRPVENNLMKQIEYLTSMLYSQLGMTTSILDGTADEKTMLNYHSRIIEPIITAIVNGMKWKFLSQTARTQGQSVMYFKNPFNLVTVSEIAEMSDKMTRNEIMSSNEVRQIIGFKPSKNPSADELRNKNLNQPENSNNDEGNGYEDEDSNSSRDEQFLDKIMRKE